MNPLLTINTIRKIGVGAAALTALLLGLSMLSPAGKELAMPGPLRSFHAPLRDQCQRCHESESDSVQSLLSGLVPSRLDHAQSLRCTHCHDSWENPTSPHGWEREQLGMSADAIECASCHREHQGRDEPLTAVSDEACQVCHEAPFESFEANHPEFDGLLRRTASRIQFDHVSHLRKHLPEADIEPDANCSECHFSDSHGARMLLRPFAESCGQCHEDEILGAKQVDGSGLTVFSIPALDLMSLEDADLAVGSWPADSQFAEGPLSPFMALLLSSSPEDLQLLTDYLALDVLDLQEASREELQLVNRLAWRLKQLSSELLRGGQAGLEQRLESLLGREMEERELAGLCGGLSCEVAGEAILSWFPSLTEELSRHASGESGADLMTFETELDLDHESELEAWVQHGGWYRQNLDSSIRYRPAGHADPFLRSWIEFTHELRRKQDTPQARALWDHLVAPGVTGVCSRCHTIDLEEESVRWSEEPAWYCEQGVTRFQHDTHFPILSEEACATCHELASTGAKVSFVEIERGVCLDCHGEAGASARCTTCHLYHAREYPLSGRGKLFSNREGSLRGK